MKKGDVLYIYVGGQNGWNGGGIGEASGGDATDIRLISGKAQDFNSLKSRIMVAAGGALIGISAQGIDNKGNNDGGGQGGTQIYGGEFGNQSILISKSQSVPAGFGYGGYNIYFPESCKKIASGVGGGYYGGGAGIHTGSCWNGGGGGSSFVSGYEGCDAISEESTENDIIHTGQYVHYSGMSFTEIEMIAGNSLVPSPVDDSKMNGNEGNGYARILYLGSD